MSFAAGVVLLYLLRGAHPTRSLEVGNSLPFVSGALLYLVRGAHPTRSLEVGKSLHFVSGAWCAP